MNHNRHELSLIVGQRSDVGDNPWRVKYRCSAVVATEMAHNCEVLLAASGETQSNAYNWIAVLFMMMTIINYSYIPALSIEE